MDTISIDIQTVEQINPRVRELNHNDTVVLCLFIGDTTSRVAYFLNSPEAVVALGQRIIQSAAYLIPGEIDGAIYEGDGEDSDSTCTDCNHTSLGDCVRA